MRELTLQIYRTMLNNRSTHDAIVVVLSEHVKTLNLVPFVAYLLAPAILSDKAEQMSPLLYSDLLIEIMANFCLYLRHLQYNTQVLFISSPRPSRR